MTQADFQRNLPLLMLDGAKVIGEATLHQRGGGWKRRTERRLRSKDNGSPRRTRQARIEA